MQCHATQRKVKTYIRAHASDIREAPIGSPAFPSDQRINHNNMMRSKEIEKTEDEDEELERTEKKY